jgi:TAG lipase/steryl ester hydrolase/phospholipase A2/LPA acyltransferase
MLARSFFLASKGDADPKQAITYEDWRTAAIELDVLEQNEAWKADSSSTYFDAALVEARLKQLDEARVNCDVTRMLFLIRTSLMRGLGDMGNIRLYKHSHIGTKYLIERYIDSALETLDALLSISAKQANPTLEAKDMLDQILSARQAFGRSALLLSGGATFGMSHVGVLKALWEAKLLPRIISGASAGSIVSAVVCTRTDEEIPELLDRFPHGDLSVFDKDGDEDGVLRRVARFLKIGAWIDISHLTRVMKNLLGDMTFQEAYNRTRRILNICVSSASVYELPRLLNYVTAPNVLIWSAV